MKPKPGDRVKVLTSDEETVGILMPNEETDSVVIKIDNGYNVGIDKKKVKKIELLESYKEKPEKKEKTFGHDKKKKLIYILHTGGTIASKVLKDRRKGQINI